LISGRIIRPRDAVGLCPATRFDGCNR
jgi:hypothetical protein